MRIAIVLSIVLLLALVGAAPVFAASPNELPTIDQLKADLDTKPQDVLRSIARILAMKTPAAAAYDRYELFMLRGEASLRTKAMPAAAEAFATASKEATDPAKKSIARANEILMRRAKQNGYAPRVPASQPTPGMKPGQPIPIINEEDRKVAMNALFNDALATVTPRVKAATNAQNLKPIMELAPTLGELHALETVAAGNAAQTKQISASVGQRAHALVGPAIADMTKRTEAHWAKGSRPNVPPNTGGVVIEQPYGMLGLTSVETSDLKNIIATAEKLAPVTTDLASATGDSGLNADAAEATRLLERAREVLEYDYPNAGRFNKTTQKQQPPPQQQPPGQTPPKKPGYGTN